MTSTQVNDSEDFTIAILDDRISQRETLRLGLEPALPDGWKCIICPLQKDIKAYPAWLNHNQVDVLLLDQLLNEQQSDSEILVNYRGDQVIEVIRKALPDFPIVFVTAVPENDDLKRAFGEADGIYNRRDLLENVQGYVPRIHRLAATFVKRNKEQLSRLGTLSEKAAEGTASVDETDELKAIQQVLSLEGGDKSQLEVMNDLEKQLKELISLEQQLQQRLK